MSFYEVTVTTEHNSLEEMKAWLHNHEVYIFSSMEEASDEMIKTGMIHRIDQIVLMSLVSFLCGQWKHYSTYRFIFLGDKEATLFKLFFG
jgi:hypothetical protein